MKKIFLLFAAALFVILLFATESIKDFQLEDEKGKMRKLSEFQEEGLVILDFWASWCVACQKALPKLNEIHQKYDDVNVVSICTDAPRTQNKAKKILKSNRYNFYTLFDSKKVVQKQFNITSIPRTIFVSPEGDIIYDHTGYQRGDEKHYEEIILEWQKGLEEETENETE